MKRLFEKHETLFCVLLIVLYVVSNSYCVQNFGEISGVGLTVNILLSALLILVMLLLGRMPYYGLTKVKNVKEHLFFLPLILIATVNLWSGFHINHSPKEILLHILTMIQIGFIEEIIFRGFLFKMMAGNGLKSAVVVSALTFGAGHVINLLNGAALLPTLMQMCYATATGYLFVVIFLKSKSLIPCIVTHCCVNALSIFNTENTVTLYIVPVFLTIVPLVYALYINRKVVQ